MHSVRKGWGEFEYERVAVAPWAADIFPDGDEWVVVLLDDDDEVDESWFPSRAAALAYVAERLGLPAVALPEVG